MAKGMHKSVMSPEAMKIPLMNYHVDPQIVTLQPGNQLLSLVRLKGISHETRSDEELDKEFSQLNRYFVALSKKQNGDLMLQTYITKSGVDLNTDYEMELETYNDFVNEYTEPFRNGTYRQVGYSVALIIRYRNLDDGIRKMKELLTMTTTMLSDYQPTIMGLETNKHGAIFSQIGRFYSMVINTHEKDVLCSDTRLGDAIIDSVTTFGEYDFVEIHPNRGGRQYATTWDLRDYPSAGSKKAMWDQAIDEQFNFTLVQTFIYEQRVKVKSKFKKHTADLKGTEGDTLQTKQLEDAVQEVTQGDKAFGRYHASLIVYGNTADEAIDNGSVMESLFTTHDTQFVRSTATNVFTWYTLLPGCQEALYPLMKSTENLACGFSIHASPTGKARGNPIGDGSALIPMSTTNDGLFLLNAHDSPVGQNNLNEQLPGHVAITGSTGVGKTTFEAALLVFFSRWNPMFFCIDYNHSLENVLRSLGASYYTISPGVDSGVNPFQWPDNSELRQHLFDTVLACAGGASVTDEDEQSLISDSIDAVMRHSIVSNRGMSLLIQNISPKGGNCLHTRLSKWCRSKNGQYSWVLDSPRNKFDPTSYTRLAFDATKIMSKEYAKKHGVAMEVIYSNLFYLKSLMHKVQPGKLLINIMAEYWVPLSFESTAEKIKEILKSGRTRGEILMMDTQSPEDALETDYAAPIVQQVVTSIWLANKKAERAGYSRFGVKGKVFDAVADLHPTSREMVVLQGGEAVKLRFSLSDKLKYWLPLLSSTDKNLPIANKIRNDLNSEDPSVWVVPFLDEMARINREKNNEE